MSNLSAPQRRPQQGRNAQSQATGTEDVISVIPEWVTKGGWIPLLAAVIAVALEADHLGHLYGAGDGWSVLAAAICIVAAVWWLGYSQRRNAYQARIDLVLHEQFQMAAIDAMTGPEFEQCSARLLAGRGYQDPEVIGGKPDEQGGDITATDRGGVKVVVQCKRQKNSVVQAIIRELIGAINSGRHHGRAGILMTSANVTAGARRLADESGIIIVDRPVLQQWVREARTQIEQRVHPYGAAPASPRGPHRTRPAARFAIGVLCCAVVLLAIVTLQAAITPPVPAMTPRSASSAAPAASSTPAVSGPSAVVREFFGAISAHDWRRVWQLGGRNLGYGPYASYAGMVAGYRDTVRDRMETLIVHGDSVSGRMLAQDTDGAIQTYQFSYRVRGTAIVAGHQTLVSVTHPSA